MKSRIKKNSWLQDITPSEYTVGIIKCTVRFLLILYLFYESILPAIVLFPLWFLYMKEWMEEKAIGKEQEFRRQFRDSIQTMAGALKAGYSVENAIRETNRDLIGMYDANTRIRKEYGQMVRKLDLNLSVVTVLNEFAAEVKQEDVTNFIQFMQQLRSVVGIQLRLSEMRLEQSERRSIQNVRYRPCWLRKSWNLKS